ncbi:MAG: hypothetical protein GXO30_01030 [Epsilonproteobacteria bacterium]|nr:hypothetical protein [Campylobacterota bacterium]
MIKKIIIASIAASTLLSAMDFGSVAGAIKTPEAIQAASKGTSVTMTDVTNSVDTNKLVGAVAGSSTTAKTTSTASKAMDKVEKVKNAKKTNDTVEKVQTGMAVGKALKLF